MPGTVRDVIGRQSTAGVAEETVDLELDGAVAAASVAVAAGVTYNISDWVVTAEAAASFRLQKTTDGVNWSDVALLRAPDDGTVGFPLNVSLINIAGSATTAFRVRVTTAGGIAAVTTTIRGYTNP